MTNQAIFEIKGKIRSIETHNGQLATIQARTQEVHNLIMFSYNTNLINEADTTVYTAELQNKFAEVLSKVTFQKIIM